MAISNDPASEDPDVDVPEWSVQNGHRTPPVRSRPPRIQRELPQMVERVKFACLREFAFGMRALQKPLDPKAAKRLLLLLCVGSVLISAARFAQDIRNGLLAEWVAAYPQPTFQDFDYHLTPANHLYGSGIEVVDDRTDFLKMNRIRIIIGNRTLTLEKPQIVSMVMAAPRTRGLLHLTLPPNISLPHSKVPALQSIVNWAGDSAGLQLVISDLAAPLCCTVFLTWLGLTILRAPVARGTPEPAVTTVSPGSATERADGRSSDKRSRLIFISVLCIVVLQLTCAAQTFLSSTSSVVQQSVQYPAFVLLQYLPYATGAVLLTAAAELFQSKLLWRAPDLETAELELPLTALNSTANYTEPGGLALIETVNGERPLMDAFRFFLAIVVCCSHLTLPALALNMLVVPSLLRTLCWNGVAGLGAVYCFFIISGYAIAASSTRNIKNFYLRRAIRIYPTLWTAMLIGLIPWLSFNPPADIQSITPLQEVFQFLGMATVFTQAWPPLGQSWSLGCEFIYYAAVPLFRRMPTWAIALIMAASYDLFVINDAGNWAWRPTINVICLVWLWLAGWLYYHYRDEKWGGAIMALFILLVVMHARQSALPVMYVCLALVLTVSRFVPFPKSLAKSCEYLGGISYTLYLVHIPVYTTLCKVCPSYMSRTPAMYIGVSLALATVVYFAVDKPAREYLTAALVKTA